MCGTQTQVSGCFLQDLHPTYKERETLGVQGLTKVRRRFAESAQSVSCRSLSRPRLCMFKTASQWERTMSRPNSRLFSSQHICGASLCSLPNWSLEPPVTSEKKYSRLSLSPAMMEWLQGTLHLLQVLFCPQIMVSKRPSLPIHHSTHFISIALKNLFPNWE